VTVSPASLEAEVRQLRYERQLLGHARRLLDEVAESGGRAPSAMFGLRERAADIAQRIVDEIGHPVTDEPALGPGMRDQLARLNLLKEWMDATGCGLSGQCILDLVADPRPTDVIVAAWKRTGHRIGCDCQRCNPNHDQEA
jgi:hypothetical protein